MTELQFLIKILTTQKLSPALKDMFIERIGEVESQISKPIAPIIRQPIGVPGLVQQAPSMQRIMDEMPLIQPATGPALPAKPVAIDKETGRPIVATGKGSMGPRKW